MKNDIVIAIDVGKGGGIAHYKNGRAQSVPMPDTTKKLYNYLLGFYEKNQSPIIFIEKVQAFISDSEEGGKNFGINKMLFNYSQLITVIEIIGYTYVTVPPISWQSTLKLKGKGLTKTERKRKYKEYAQNCFPEVTVNLKTSDALCILQFAFVKTASDKVWIEKYINRPEAEGLF